MDRAKLSLARFRELQGFIAQAVKFVDSVRGTDGKMRKIGGIVLPFKAPSPETTWIIRAHAEKEAHAVTIIGRTDREGHRGYAIMLHDRTLYLGYIVSIIRLLECKKRNIKVTQENERYLSFYGRPQVGGFNVWDASEQHQEIVSRVAKDWATMIPFEEICDLLVTHLTEPDALRTNPIFNAVKLAAPKKTAAPKQGPKAATPRRYKTGAPVHVRFGPQGEQVVVASA